MIISGSQKDTQFPYSILDNGHESTLNLSLVKALDYVECMAHIWNSSDTMTERSILVGNEMHSRFYTNVKFK